MSRILFPIHGFPPHQVGGSEVYTAGLAEALSKTDDVAVIYPVVDRAKATISLNKKAKRDNFVRYEIVGNFSNPRRMFYDIDSQERTAFVAAFEQALADFSPEIVHFQHLLGYPALEVLQKAAATSVPILFTMHDHWLICPAIHYLRSDEKPCIGPQHGLWTCAACLRNIPLDAVNRALSPLRAVGVLSALEKSPISRLDFGMFLQRDLVMDQVLSYIDILVSPSQSLGQRIGAKKTHAAEKIRHIPYGHKPLPKCQQLSSNSDRSRPTVGFIGTFTRGKGVHVLLAAAALLQSKAPEINVELHGYSPDATFQSAIEAQATRLPNVRLLGPYQREDLPCIFQRFDCLVVPSIWYENSPLVISEAFLAGVPVITSRLGGMAEIVWGGEKGGILFEAGDPQSLTDAILRFFREPDLQETICDTIPPVVDFDQHVLELKRLYDEVILGMR